MACYPDLSPWPEFGEEAARKLIAVAWLGTEAPYTRGPVDEVFVDRLFDLLRDPWQAIHGCWWEYRCEFCRLSGGPGSVRCGDREVSSGGTHLFVPGDAALYVAPAMIAHFIDAHEYLPPEEFRQAVLRCPPMRSVRYLRALLQNGPRTLFDLKKSGAVCA